MSCCICIEDTKEPIGTTYCNHEYHQSCFDKWIATCKAQHEPIVTCCTCREKIINLELTLLPSYESLRQEAQLLRRINRTQADQVAALATLKVEYVKEIRLQALEISGKNLVIDRLSKTVDQLIAELSARPLSKYKNEK